ncbi:alpha/beta hydrolase [Paenibacillus sp. M1]|uniref:Alpha/beta hydrolase n=1 Tax=Paenibacillus haidiansis TaxID=1574488 RepID=A0ABU7VZV4_9BACL
MVAFLVVVMLAAALYLYSQYKFRRLKKQFPPAGKVVTVEGIKLHYISGGEGRPVVFLHGGVLNGNDFEQVIDMAAAGGFRGIAFDRPGYGYSERPKSEPVTPKLQARLLQKALKELGVEKPILVGHSWSGVLMLTYALDYPDDLVGLVTLGAGMYPEGYPAEKGDPISTIITTPVLGSILMNMLLAVLGPPLADKILKETFKPEQVPEAYRKATFAYWLRPSQFKANREDVLAFVPAAKAVSGRYKEIKVPLVIVVGADDPFETREHSLRLHQEIPSSKLIVQENVAHMIPQKHPDVVMKAIETLQLNRVQNI